MFDTVLHTPLEDIPKKNYNHYLNKATKSPFKNYVMENFWTITNHNFLISTRTCEYQGLQQVNNQKLFDTYFLSDP